MADHAKPERQDVKRALVIGDGGWGTTLALALHKNGIPVCLWSAFPEQAREMREQRENKRFLPGIQLPADLEITADAMRAAQGVDFVVSVVPTQYLRGVMSVFEEALPGQVPIVSATKGIEIETFRTPAQVLREVLGERSTCVLTGPSHAEEVALGKPCSIIAASEDQAFARRVQKAFSSSSFRIYTSRDPVGAELAAALKNVIAIGAGVCDGLGFGDNSKAALVTRSISEVRRLGVACGAQAETFSGLSGLGDLIVTCYSKLSRNHGFGERLGRGEKAEAIVASMVAVAEGYPTARAAHELARKRKVVTPVIDEVYAMLYEGKDVRQAVQDLTSRESKAED
jgi:glycerol-3-phosphate dehydrogenase (NAD(P)+)